ncbi:uncharacterized protein LOC113287919 isoform X2 [Papaver somniferum]|uniref:uncharacterized protein LOC113287919 isoform X2 n=1 Tax=Papaver somniferum TaxID=3469 RepID=UPI000E6FC97B|nr:uncharacterized protein LOC113287919 isoform X2 [Papaver somniferum]
MATMPIKDGGLGVYTMADTDAAPHYMKSLTTIYFGGVRNTLPSSFALNDREYLLWQYNKKEHAMDFLKSIPISGMNQSVGSRQFSVVLQYRLDNGNPSRPADIIVYNWKYGKDVCFNVTGVSPFTSARTRNFTPGHAINVAVSRKVNKYLNICTTHGYGFKALDFTTLGELGEDTILFLKRVGNCLASHDANYKVGSSLFYRLGIIIQKGVGAQLVARLPTNSL